MNRSKMSIVAVGFVGVMAFTASAFAGRPGSGNSNVGKGPKTIQFNDNSVLQNVNSTTLKQLGNTAPVANPVINKFPGNPGRVLGNIGGTNSIGSNPEKGHGPVVPPNSSTPVTWGGNPPRAPQHGCEHHCHHDWLCGWFNCDVVDLSIWGIDTCDDSAAE